MRGIFHGDYVHVKNKLYERCAGFDHSELWKEHAFNDDLYVGLMLIGVWQDNHKHGQKKANKTSSRKYGIITGKKVAQTTVRSCKVAQKIKKEGHLDLLKNYGFIKCDTMGNLYATAQRCKDEDAETR